MSDLTTHPAANTTDAQFLAPETERNAGPAKQPMLRIGDFRSAVDSLNWSRIDLTGATRDEFIRMDVPTRLQRRIGTVVDLLLRVPARFVEDIRHARESIALAEATIARWRAAQPKVETAVREGEPA